METFKNLIFGQKFFGMLLTIAVFNLFVFLKKFIKNKWIRTLFNPLLLTIIVIALFLKLCKIEYNTYFGTMAVPGAGLLQLGVLLGTICLAVPLYEKIDLLKKYWIEVFVSLFIGTLAGLLTIYGIAKIAGYNNSLIASVLPKSITLGIALDLCKQFKGVSEITSVLVVFTGVFGAFISDIVFTIFRIKDHVAKGLGLGASSLAIGASKALENDPIEGAFASTSIVICGIYTIILLNIFHACSMF